MSNWTDLDRLLRKGAVDETMAYAAKGKVQAKAYELRREL